MKPPPREFIEAEVVFLSPAEGGRATLLQAGSYAGTYRPHIVLQSRDVRGAKFGLLHGERGVVDEYLGVAFWSGPAPIPVGEPAIITMFLMFMPHPAYDSVQAGAEFTMREGAKVVAHGKVLRRWTAENA